MKYVDWNYLKILLEERLNIPGRVLDTIAVKDILQLCASGSSNENISKVTEADLEYVVDVLREFLLFFGWTIDCDLNPLTLYNSLVDDLYSFDLFEREINILYPYYTKEEIMQMYQVAHLYKQIEDEMEKFWV